MLIDDDRSYDDEQDGGGLNLYPKQKEVLRVLLDPAYSHIYQVLYGGAIRSSKTYTAAVYVLTVCLNYPGVRGVVVRRNRNLLELNFLESLAEVCGHAYGPNAPLPYQVIKSPNLVIKWDNGSEVLLIGLDQGRDQFFNRIRGWSGAFAVLEEGQEQDDEAILSTLGSRLSQAGSFGLSPKVLITCNPSPPHHFLHRLFYSPKKEGTLPPFRYFVQAGPKDNLSLDDQWHAMQAATMTPQDYQINYLGNWEYVTTEGEIFQADSLHHAFANPPRKTGLHYITCDPATDTGKDSTVVTVWHGMDLIRLVRSPDANAAQVVGLVREMQQIYNVPSNRVIVDSTGVGYGICQALNAVPFMASSSPLKGEPYNHLKSQLYFRLAQGIGKGEVTFQGIDPQTQGMIMEELLAHKHVDPYKDTKNKVTPKDVVKANIGRSPDLSDAISFRMWFVYQSNEFLIEWL